MFHQKNFKLDTLIINHFIIENNLYGMVTRHSFRWVPWRSKTSLSFSFTLYTFILFLLGIQKSNTNLTISFFHEYHIWRTPEWNSQCITKKESFIYPYQHNSLRVQFFLTFTQRHLKRNNATHWLKAGIIDNQTFFSPVSKYIVPWKTSYLNILNISLYISFTFKVTLVAFADVFEDYFYFCDNSWPNQNVNF